MARTENMTCIQWNRIKHPEITLHSYSLNNAVKGFTRRKPLQQMVLRTLGIYTQERMKPGAKLSLAGKKNNSKCNKDFNIKPDIQKLLMKTLGKNH